VPRTVPFVCHVIQQSGANLALLSQLSTVPTSRPVGGRQRVQGVILGLPGDLREQKRAHGCELVSRDSVRKTVKLCELDVERRRHFAALVLSKVSSNDFVVGAVAEEDRQLALPFGRLRSVCTGDAWQVPHAEGNDAADLLVH
jgi:hypothetical protein